MLEMKKLMKINPRRGIEQEIPFHYKKRTCLFL